MLAIIPVFFSKPECLHHVATINQGRAVIKDHAITEEVAVGIHALSEDEEEDVVGEEAAGRVEENFCIYIFMRTLRKDFSILKLFTW